jgi:cyclophilin family peptidyl-prolyl cis-trans isomerase
MTTMSDRRRRFLDFAAPSFDTLEARLVFASAPPDNHTLVNLDTNFGAIVIELFDDAAPITVTNFLNYVNSDRLNDTFFHRMVKKGDGGIDILQGGSYYMRQGQTGSPPEVDTDAPIQLEAPAQTGLSNIAGTIAMARTTNPNSATSGFYFNVTDNVGLDTNGGGYAVFGRVVAGFNVLDTMFSQDRINAGGAFTNLPVTDALADDATVLTPADVLLLEDASVIDRTVYRTTPGSPVYGATNSADDLIVSSIGADGTSHVFTPDESRAWTYTNLTNVTGAPRVTGNLVTFFDPATGQQGAVGPSAQGMILFTRSAAGTWSFTNLSTTTGGEAVAGTITVFKSTDNLMHAAGVTASGDVVVYHQTAGGQWVYRNISDDDLTVRGLSTPQFVGSLTSYVTSWNGLNIVGLDSTGEMQVVWWAPGIDSGLWTTSNLSDITGAPRLTGGLTVYLTSWQATNIVGITQDGHVSITWWLPSFGGDWNTNDLTSQFSGPTLVASSISSYVTPWGATNIAGLNQDGRLWVYWWTPSLGDGAWVISDLFSALPAGTTPMVGQINGVTSNASTINLVGSAANGDVMRYSWSPSDTLGWQADDVSYRASVNT